MRHLVMIIDIVGSKGLEIVGIGVSTGIAFEVDKQTMIEWLTPAIDYFCRRKRLQNPTDNEVMAWKRVDKETRSGRFRDNVCHVSLADLLYLRIAQGPQAFGPLLGNAVLVEHALDGVGPFLPFTGAVDLIVRREK